MTSLHFAQLSDIHISDLGNHHDLLSGQSLNYLENIVTQFNQTADLDFVLISGDLLDTASLTELADFQSTIAALRKPYYVVPGNHDLRSFSNNGGLSRQQFAHSFNPQLKDRTAAIGTQLGYWSIAVTPKVQLIGLDSTRYRDWGGILDSAQIHWLDHELAAHQQKFVVVMVHHPLHRQAPIDNLPDWGNFLCDNGSDLLALLDAHPQVKLVLTGHHHITKADRLGKRWHLACPALVIYPCAYRTFRLRETATGGWELTWQTHPATDAATIATARRLFLDSWQTVGFDVDFIETHAILALGNQIDQQGRATFPKT